MLRGERRIWWVAVLLGLGGVPGVSWGIDREVVISVYQGPCQDGDFAANLATVREVVKEALERESDFVVFPETFLSGYVTPEAVRQGARRVDDPALQEFIRESNSHRMVILVGMARLEAEGLFNTVLVIHRGRVLGHYDKIMLTGGDRDRLGFLPGRDTPVFEAHGVTFGVIICHDSSFPQVALAEKQKGAEIIFSPHYNAISASVMDRHRQWVRNCHVGLACQLKVVVARSNVVVTDAEHGLGYGDSFILGPGGQVLAAAKLFATGLTTARIAPALYRSPSVWADFKEVPDWLNAELGAQLEAAGKAGSEGVR